MPWLGSTIPTSVIKAVDLEYVLSDSSQPLGFVLSVIRVGLSSTALFGDLNQH